MKKLISVLMMLVFLLTACSNPMPPEEPEIPDAQIPEEPSENDFSINDIDLSEYDEVKDWEFMYVLIKTEGTRIGLHHDENHFSSLAEVPDKKIWLLLKNGEFISEEPFDDFICYGGNIDSPDKQWIAACRDGSRYEYDVNEKTFEILGEGISPATSVKTFGLNLNSYYWKARYPSHGVTAEDGTVILENHYGRLYIPFPDRILAADKASDMWSDSHCIIFDEKGNVINSSYNHIRFSVLYEGYIGVAYCADPETTYEYEFYQCHDSDGNPMPGGYWLIDKDGNPISERFDHLYIEKEWQLFATSPDNIIHAFTENGEEKTFTVESVLIK